MDDTDTLNKQRIIRLVGQRTRLSNQIAAQIVEALIQLLTEEIASGRRVEIENFLTLQVQSRVRKIAVSDKICQVMRLRRRFIL